MLTTVSSAAPLQLRVAWGCGSDLLYGGAGADIFDFNSITDTRLSARDTIGDLVCGVDRIDLRGIDANSKLLGDQAFVSIGNKAFSGKVGHLTFSIGVLSGDVNGDRMADFQKKVLEPVWKFRNERFFG